MKEQALSSEPLVGNNTYVKFNIILFSLYFFLCLFPSIYGRKVLVFHFWSNIRLSFTISLSLKMSRFKENILLIIVKIISDLKTMGMGYEVICHCLKVGKNSRASLSHLSKITCTVAEEI